MDLNPSIIDYILDDNRNISLQLRGQIGTITITGTHAPHAKATNEEKTAYYDKIEEINDKYSYGPNTHFIGGDFNARIIERAPAEETLIGPHVFNPSSETINVLSDEQQNSRERFIAFCVKKQLVPINTWFQKNTRATSHIQVATHKKLQRTNQYL